MTGNKKIKQLKFYYSCAKFRAFTDVMLDSDEKEWKVFVSRQEEFFNDPKNSNLKRSSLMELMNKVVYCVDNILFTLGSRYNRKI